MHGPIRWLLTAFLGAAAFNTGTALAANPFEKNSYLLGPRYDGALPACESALAEITWRFADNERTFWNSALQIVGFENLNETGFRPWQSDNIPRRYCSVRAMISDGKPRMVHYSIVEDGGLASFSNGVEYCVVGLDRDWAYNPACRAAKP